MICPYCKKEIEPVEETTSTVSIKNENGQMETWTEETRDIDGILLSKRVDDYSYYMTGDIDTINLKVYDGENSLQSEKQIKHLDSKIISDDVPIEKS